MSLFLQGLENELNKSITENGAEGYKTTGKSIVDFNFKISSYRNKSEKEILNDFKDVWFEDKELALKFLFYIRDVREGVGERRLFRVILPEIAYQLDNRVFDWIMEYGRADDLFVFFGTEKEKDMIAYVTNKLSEDMKNSQDNKSISNLSKWMPSINCSSNKTKELARKFIKALGIQEKMYRKLLAHLRSYANVVETKTCRNNWGDITYSAVPSLANLKYKNAFMKHDEERYKEYLKSVEKGELKINSSVTFPHDIIHKYIRYGMHTAHADATLEEMWKALPNYVRGNSSTLVVRDGSGSMTWENLGNSNVTPLEIATALSIYFSERCHGDFKDKFITFSSSPQLVRLNNFTTLHDKLIECYNYSDCSNTNIAATFKLVLDVAVKNKLKQEEIPNLLIISDMEFDAINSSGKLFKEIENRFNVAGYEMPKLIFWNVCSRTNTIPLTENKQGVTLVSGFSPAIVKVVLNGELDPYKALIKEITGERYKQVTLTV